jgi:hypothetical protein
MTLRERIADLISGGELTRLRSDLKDRDTMLEAAAAIVSRRTDALRTIAAMPTPGANATVRRMARVAQEALK